MRLYPARGILIVGHCAPSISFSFLSLAGILPVAVDFNFALQIGLACDLHAKLVIHELNSLQVELSLTIYRLFLPRLRPVSLFDSLKKFENLLVLLCSLSDHFLLLSGLLIALDLIFFNPIADTHEDKTAEDH